MKTITFVPDKPLKAILSWQGDFDLDLSAFLLDDSGYVVGDGGVVFYNSPIRTEPFDPMRFSCEQHWRDMTLPISADGAVCGPADAEGASDIRSVEEIALDLSRIDPAVVHIVLCVTSCAKSAGLPPLASVPAAKLSVAGCPDEIVIDMSGIDLDATAAEMIQLSRSDNGQWSIIPVNAGITGGLTALIEKYV